MVVAVLTMATATVGIAAVVTPNSGGLVAVGPTSAANGFPVWYTDSNDTTLELCLDGQDPLCGLLPEDGYDPTAPTVFPTNFPGEAFWFLGESTLQTPFEGGDGEALVLFGLEAAFSVDEVKDGDQVSFGRIRIRIDTTAAGVYTVEHPYGVDRFEAAAGERAINYTEDIGIGSPGDFTGALDSRVGPFLRWDAGAPAGYVGDPNVAHTVTGSPVDTNFVRITGPGIGQGSADQCVGDELPAGVLATDCIYSDLFTIMGKEAVNFGVEAQRAVYAGSDGAAAMQVFARSAAGEFIQVAEAPGIAATELRGDTAGNYFATVPITGTIPDTITVENVGDEPVSTKVLDLVDEVVIHNTAYDEAARTLTVDAVSGDPAATLTVTGLGPLDAGGHALFTDVEVPPLLVEVTSSAGGSSTRYPTMTAGTMPPPPAETTAAPTITSATAGDGTATVAWTAPVDTAGITGYTVQAVDPERTVVRETTTDAATTTATVDGLANGTPYILRVAANTAAGPGAFASSAPVTPTLATPAATAPVAPTVGTATAGDGQATLTWTGPDSDGGSAITRYVVRAVGPAGTTPVEAAIDDPAALTGTVTGLANGTPYRLQVAAGNAVGLSPYSDLSNEVTPAAPATVAGAPTISSAAAGDRGATLSWSAPTDDGGSAITGYTVQALDPSGAVAKEQFAAAGASMATLTGLTNGVTYSLQVAATNGVGTGAYSAPVAVTPATVPAAPTIGTATARPGEATVTWSAPADNGGSAITGYTVQALDAGGAVAKEQSAEAGAVTATVTGLTNGTTYTLRVAAVNGVGTGAFSAASNEVTPVTAPGAPTIGTASRGDREATVTWTAPADDGGSTITGYTVQALGPNGAVAREVPATADATSATVDGLTNGTAYTLRVAAVNAVGTGAFSAPSNPVTPATVPGAPTGVTAESGDFDIFAWFFGGDDPTVDVAWSAPASNGGSPVTGYIVTATATGAPTKEVRVGSEGRSAELPDLERGVTYTVTVRAVNGVGASAPSGPATATAQ